MDTLDNIYNIINLHSPINLEKTYFDNLLNLNYTNYISKLIFEEYEQTFYKDNNYTNDNNLTYNDNYYSYDNDYYYKDIVYCTVNLLYLISCITLSYIIANFIFNKTISNTINKDLNDSSKVSKVSKVTMIPNTLYLYISSLIEIINKYSMLSETIKTNKDYIILFRVKLQTPITFINRTKTIKYMYMINGLRITDTESIKQINISGIISTNLNYLNKIFDNKYKTNDFIVLGISCIHNDKNDNNDKNDKNDKYILFNEFYKGLNNLKFDFDDIHNEKLNYINDTNLKLILIEPSFKVYNLFMDVYTDIVFESKHYKIDKNNLEFWHNYSLEN